MIEVRYRGQCLSAGPFIHNCPVETHYALIVGSWPQCTHLTHMGFRVEFFNLEA